MADHSEQVRVEQLFDARLIDETMRHPRIYPHIKDDFCPEKAYDFVPPIDDAHTYVGAYRGDEYLGLFLLHPHTHILWEVHTCLLPVAWGSTALKCTTACAQWVWDNTPCQRLITAVPEGNELALRLARRSGMGEYGVNPKSFARGGVLISQTLLGMNRS